jgi:hypothetical protein
MFLGYWVLDIGSWFLVLGSGHWYFDFVWDLVRGTWNLELGT